MLYRPDFCCSCGEKVDRIEWHIWTSRRFCELCQTEHQFDEWLPRILGAFFMILGLTGLGSLLRESRPDIAGDPVGVALRRAASGRVLPADGVPESTVYKVEEPPELPVAQAPPPNETGGEMRPDGAADEEPVYYCGALTKKGTPCTRKVKGGGRCWQHKGMSPPAAQKDDPNGGNSDQAAGANRN